MRFGPGTRLGSYEILSLIGSGGMGEVYRARDLKLDREVAIKVLSADLASDPAALARFEREAKALAALSHPNVLSVHDYGAEGNDWYLVTELLEGESLRTALAQVSTDAGTGRRPPLAKAVEWGLAVAQGLAAAHARGLVHRDLKPENVFVTHDGLIKILDFGLVRDAGPHGGAAASTRTPVSGVGMVVGSMPYMSPEQAQGNRVDHRSDIFSFGTMLYELVTGRHPFMTGSALQTTQRILEADPDPVDAMAPDAPLELQWIISKCLAKDPAERYQASSEIVVDLQRVKKQIDSGVSAIRSSHVMAPVHPRRRMWPIIVAALVVVLSAASAVLVWRARFATTSSPASLLSMQPLTSSGNVIDAAISPDGKYVVYVESDKGLQALFLKQIATGTQIELMRPSPVQTWGITFSPDGSSIYYALKTDEDPGGTLFRISSLGGPPTRLLSGIDSVVSFSPDGSRIAYVRAAFPSANESSVMVARADGSDPRVLAARKDPLQIAPGFFQSVAWSPDGGVTYTGVRDVATNVCRIVRLQVSDGRELPFEFAPERAFRLIGHVRALRDGSGLLFIGSTTMGPLPYFAGAEQLWFLPRGSSVPRQITGDVESFRDISLTTDERALVTVTTTGWGSLWRANTDGTGAQRVLSSRNDAMSQITALGDRILFRSVVAGRTDIWSMDANGNDRRPLTSDGLDAWPAGSPGGRFVAFVSGRNGGYRLWRMDADGSHPRELAATATPGRPAISADGNWIAFSESAAGRSGLWRVPGDGGPLRKLFDGRTTAPAISPDGGSIAFARGMPDGSAELTVIRSDTGALERHFSVDASRCMVRWSADGRSLFHNCGGDGLDIWRQPLEGGLSRRIPRFGDDPITAFDVFGDHTLIVLRAVLARDARLLTNFR